jgi:hypothetical protein
MEIKAVNVKARKGQISLSGNLISLNDGRPL